MFLTYSELLNSLDSGATTKITLNNHRLNKREFEASILMPMQEDCSFVNDVRLKKRERVTRLGMWFC